MEIGSFIEMQLPKGTEYYSGDTIREMDIVRLNSGRAALWHAFRITGCSSIWIPYYQCDTVRSFFIQMHVQIKYYHIDDHFRPIDVHQKPDEAIMLVNYYGVMADYRMIALSGCFKNVIIDNSQSFYANPIDNCQNVYSTRKFFGVPDGAYVIGKNASSFLSEYEQGYSSDTSLFLLQRIEYGCEGKAYKSRMENEQRIAKESIRLMSKLTRTILCGTDYQEASAKRKENFQIAKELFDSQNLIQVSKFTDSLCIPMVYPLVVEDDSLLTKLLEVKHFQGHWWSYLTKEMPKNTFEHWISRYMIPITIDQRYEANSLLPFFHSLLDFL